MSNNGPPSSSFVRQARSGYPARAVALCIIAIAAGFWLLRETYAVTMPVLAALLLALAVWPVVQPLRDRMPKHLKWLGAASGLLIVLLILFAFLIGLGLALQQIYELSSTLAPQLNERIGSLPLPDIVSDGPDPGSQSLISAGGLASRALAALGITAGVASGIILILFLMLLMLTETENWHRKMLALAGPGGERRWPEIGRSVGKKFRAYFTTRFILGVITAALYVAWLAAFDVDYLLLWGVLAVLLNFIPTVGSIIAGALPVLYVLIVRDPLSAAIVAGGLLVIEQVMGNFVDPKLMGRRLAVSPLVVLVALVFWTLIWGAVGAVLAVPLTVFATVVMAHSERLKPVALLLTDCDDFDDLDDYSKPG
tara:strand:- start:10858 stop:11961 length:1104 start_codon:yes stop_codon:yes gene_type:complete